MPCCRPWRQLQEALSWTGAAQAKQLMSSVQELWERHSSDDLVSMFLVLIDAYVTKVGSLCRQVSHSQPQCNARFASYPAATHRVNISLAARACTSTPCSITVESRTCILPCRFNPYHPLLMAPACRYGSGRVGRLLACKACLADAHSDQRIRN